MAMKIAISMILAGLIALIVQKFTQDPFLASIALLIMGGLLLVASQLVKIK